MRLCRLIRRRREAERNWPLWMCENVVLIEEVEELDEEEARAGGRGGAAGTAGTAGTGIRFLGPAQAAKVTKAEGALQQRPCNSSRCSVPAGLGATSCTAGSAEDAVCDGSF